MGLLCRSVKIICGWFLLAVQVILEGDKVEFSPTLKQLAHSVGSIGGHLTDTISDIRRLPDLLTRRKSMKEAIHVVIAKDDEVKKTEKLINNGMQANAANLQNYLATWDNYRCIQALLIYNTP